MFNYLDVIELIVMALSMFTGIIRAAFTFTKKNTIDTYIFWMYFSAVLTLAGEFVNYFLCKSDAIIPVCIGTWITFQVTMQWSMAFFASLQFLTFYILQTQSQAFMEEIKNSRNQFLCLSLFFPILIGFLNFFVQDSSYSVFHPPNNRFQVIVLFAPLSFLLIVITIFTVMSLKILRKGTDFSPEFRNNYQRALKVQLAMKLITFIPFLLIVIAAQFTCSLDTAYLILLCIVNLQVLQYNYLFGVNSFIHRVQVFKISKLIGITASDMDESDLTYAQTQTATETQLTNNQRFSGNPSKVAEMAISRDSGNIRSETQKPKIVGSEKQKVTAVEMKKKAHSNITNP